MPRRPARPREAATPVYVPPGFSGRPASGDAAHGADWRVPARRDRRRPQPDTDRRGGSHAGDAQGPVNRPAFAVGSDHRPGRRQLDRGLVAVRRRIDPRRGTDTPPGTPRQLGHPPPRLALFVDGRAAVAVPPQEGREEPRCRSGCSAVDKIDPPRPSSSASRSPGREPEEPRPHCRGRGVVAQAGSGARPTRYRSRGLRRDRLADRRRSPSCSTCSGGMPRRSRSRPWRTSWPTTAT